MGDAPAWTAALALRMRRHVVLKIVGISAVTWLFFVGYFHLLRHPASAVFQMPLMAIDHWIPFQPAWLLAYVSLWFYVGIAPGLMLGLRALIGYGVWIAGLCIAGLAAFYFWPSAVPARAIEAAGFPGFAVLQGVDAAGNACPSMHVAAAIFSAVWTEVLLRSIAAPPWSRAINALWFLAIAYSTLAIKQHVMWDVLAGAGLGLAFALPSVWALRGPMRQDLLASADIIDRRTGR